MKRALALPDTGARRQSGAALVIGLVLLLVLTVLGISGMTAGTFELTMADNAQRAQYAFQAAESAIDVAIDDAGPVVIDDATAPGDQVGETRVLSYAPAGTEVAVAEAATTFRTIAGMAPGGGWEAGTMSAVHFQVRGQADSGRGARSEQRAGYYIMAPAQ